MFLNGDVSWNIYRRYITHGTFWKDKIKIKRIQDAIVMVTVRSFEYRSTTAPAETKRAMGMDIYKKQTSMEGSEMMQNNSLILEILL